MRHEYAINASALFFFFVSRLEYSRQETSKKQESCIDGPPPELQVSCIYMGKNSACGSCLLHSEEVIPVSAAENSQ